MTAFTLEYEINKRIDLLAPACVLEIDLDKPIVSVSGLEAYVTAYTVFYYGGRPLGVGILPIHGDQCLAGEIEEASAGFVQQQQRVEIEKYLDTGFANRGVQATDGTGITVIIPTCNRQQHLKRCLHALQRQTRNPDRIIVVDNCPDNNEVSQLLKDDFPGVEYLACTIKGVSAARNAGAAISDSEYLAFLDDDVCPSPLWLEKISVEISRDQRIAVATGLVLPAEISTESQAKMEALGGFNGGFLPRWVIPVVDRNTASHSFLEFPVLGAGCQFLVRRAIFDQLGGFDEQIGAGLGIDGEDVDLYARAVDAGHILFYEPAAVVFHHHRDTPEEFEQQFLRAAWSTAYLWGRLARRYRRLRGAANNYFRKYFRLLARQSLHASFRPDIISGKLRRQKLLQFIKGYLKGRFTQDHVKLSLWPSKKKLTAATANSSVSVRQLDLFRRIPFFLDSSGHEGVEVQVFCGEKYVLSLRMPATDSCVSTRQVLAALPDEIIDGLLIDLKTNHLLTTAAKPFCLMDMGGHSSLRLNRFFYWRPSVSIVIPTRDRPADLVDCLWRISRQDYDGELQVIVVDNNPQSGLSRPIVEQFPRFLYLACEKPGAAATRNTGFKKAKGEIIALADDDVLVPQGWIRNIVQRFWRQDVWMVNGSVLPYELSSRAELDFEDNCGFPSSHTTIEATGDVIRNRRYIPAVMFGVSANMAFRRNVIENPAIGVMNEVLGPGTPAGAGEDLEFIYRVLKEGHTVVFEPAIWVYHRHRRTTAELNRQIYNYGKSAPALYLHILIGHHDFIAIPALLFHVPKNLIMLLFISGGRYWKLGLHGIGGYLVGFPAYFWSRLRDRRYSR